MNGRVVMGIKALSQGKIRARARFRDRGRDKRKEWTVNLHS